MEDYGLFPPGEAPAETVGVRDTRRLAEPDELNRTCEKCFSKSLDGLILTCAIYGFEQINDEFRETCDYFEPVSAFSKYR
jgi:hypothetical protein